MDDTWEWDATIYPEATGPAAEVLRLRARIAELEAAQRWRPIETAPRGVDILVRGRGDGGQYFVALTNCDDGLFFFDGQIAQEWVTHWMPVPSTELPDA